MIELIINKQNRTLKNILTASLWTITIKEDGFYIFKLAAMTRAAAIRAPGINVMNDLRFGQTYEIKDNT